MSIKKFSLKKVTILFSVIVMVVSLLCVWVGLFVSMGRPAQRGLPQTILALQMKAEATEQDPIPLL